MIDIRKTPEFAEWIDNLRDNVLLSGGDKSSQTRDIAQAKTLAEGLEVTYDH